MTDHPTLHVIGAPTTDEVLKQNMIALLERRLAEVRAGEVKCIAVIAVLHSGDYCITKDGPMRRMEQAKFDALSEDH